MLSWIATSVTPSCNVLNLNLKCWKILGSQGLPDPFSAGSCISWFVENENNGLVTYFSSVHFIRRASQQCCQKQLNTCSADLLSHSADSCRAAAAAKQKNKNNCESRYMFLDLKDLRRISTLEDSPLALDCTAYQDNDRILITAFSAAGHHHQFEIKDHILCSIIGKFNFSDREALASPERTVYHRSFSNITSLPKEWPFVNHYILGNM